MTQLVLSDPTLRRCADRMAGGRPSTDGRLSHVLAAAIAVGLNYGLRIGDQRLQDLIIEIGRERLERRTADPNRPLPEPDTPETVAEKLRGAADSAERFEALGRGVVVIEWNAESGQFDPEDARVFAHRLLREADNAETDAWLYNFFRTRVELDANRLGQFITDFREARAKREMNAGLRTERDEIPEEDRR